jgi:thioredoxin 1
MIQIENKQQLKQILSENSAVVLDFYAEWCGPCKQLLPIVEKVSQEQQDVVYCKINVDSNSEIASEYAVRSIPALKYIKDGEVVKTTLGSRPMTEIVENSRELL